MRRGLTVAAGALAASLTAACSPATLLGRLQPAAPGGEIRDIAYESGLRHTMDLYLPAPAARRPPVVVFFYGGGWKSGDKEMYRFVGRSLAGCGAMTVIPDYRVWPQAGFPGFLQDAAAAVAVARTEGARRGGDPSRLFLVGHSAGAYIAAMLALDPEWLGAAGVDARHALAGVVGLAGPYDFLPLNDPVLEQIFAPVGPRTQPITFAANAAAPMLLAAGTDDKTVDPANTRRLAARVEHAGGQVTSILYPGIGHAALVGAIGAPLRFLAPVRADICRFIGVAAPGGSAGAVAR